MYLIKPIITEKTMQMAPNNQYTFEVEPNANKIEIAKEVKRLYKAEVKEVRIQNIRGKVKAFRRHLGKQSDVKKAIIILKPGSKIPGFEMSTEDDKTKEGRNDK